MKKPKSPYTVTNFDQVIEIDMKKPLGLTVRPIIQEQARTLDIYNEVFECDITGKDNDGNSIKVNTVGRYVFGVPGYPGNVRITTDQNKVLIYYSSKAPKEVSTLLTQLKDKVTKQFLSFNK